jgi:hypothetical protein
MAEPQILPLNLPSEAAQALAAAADALKNVAIVLGSLGGASVVTNVFDDAPSVVDVTNQLLRSKARAEKSDDYLKNLRIHLRKFSQATNNAALASLTTLQVERWLDGLDVSTRTRKGHLDSVRLLFNFAVARGYVKTNPALAVELPPDASRSKPVEIHSVAQVAMVLHTTRAVDLNLMRFLAVRYFAGLRASEAQECVIELERGFIEVPARVAKTRRRRLVKIQPVLASWLALGGVLPLRDLNTRLSRVGALAGVPWSRNVTRHSFCSYHLAKFQSAANTALEAGHTEEMLFGHYRECVTEQAAAEFWSLTPEKAASVSATFHGINQLTKKSS